MGSYTAFRAPDRPAGCEGTPGARALCAADLPRPRGSALGSLCGDFSETRSGLSLGVEKKKEKQMIKKKLAALSCDLFPTRRQRLTLVSL